MQFNIINIKTEEKFQIDGRVWKGPEYLADIQLAALNIPGSPPIYRKKVIITDDWIGREADKMYGEYAGAEPVWMNNGDHRMQRAIWYDLYDAWTGGNVRVKHFAIVSQSDPLFISYFPDEEKGMLNKRVKISPGKYLKKYFSHIYSDLEIEAYANQHKEKYSAVEVLWANTPEEISNVYKMPNTGFTSCMQKQDDVFSSTIKKNPTYVYGAGDLSLAYVVKDGYLTTRALVWREKNKVGRVYGDPFILRAGLAKEGIETKSNNNEYDTFEGARLIKEFHEYDNKKMAIAPYIDGNVRWLKEEGEYLVIDKEGRYHAEWTDGMARPRPFCERQQTYVNETIMVNIRNEDGTYHLAEWDRYTDHSLMVNVQNSGEYSHNNSRYYETNSPDLFVVTNRYLEPRYYTTKYREAYPDRFWISDISGKLYSNDFFGYVTVEGKKMTEEERDVHSFYSDFDRMPYLKTNKVKVEGAGYWHINQAREHAHQMIEGDDTLFTLKRGLVFMGGRVVKKPKPSSKFSHLINYSGAEKLANKFTLNYVASASGRDRYEVDAGQYYLQSIDRHDLWETNAPRDMFEPDELVA